MNPSAQPNLPLSQVDHLVVAAATLAEGVKWCETVLGITPGPGGHHPLMGTHNRLITMASAAFPAAYIEVIAIEPGVYSARKSSTNNDDHTKRWFDLDDHALQMQLAQSGPQLIHFVARTPQAETSVRALTGLGLDRGRLIEASRNTPQGLLQWKIAVRDDGQRLFYGTLPTLIEWGDVHPTKSMPPSGVTLVSLQAMHPRPDALRVAYEAIGLMGVDLQRGAPNLVAVLRTPGGVVRLESKGV